MTTRLLLLAAATASTITMAGIANMTLTAKLEAVSNQPPT